jgi:hypothetical protein
MHALLALTSATALDLWRRASTRLIALAAVPCILSLRYFSAFGLGYEVVQLKELGVYTVGLFGALAALLFCLPRDDDEGDAEGLLLVRPVSPRTLALGLYFGRVVVAVDDPRLFTFRGETTVSEQAGSLWAPVFGQWLTLCVLLALAQPIARARRPMLIAIAFMLIYLAGFAAPSLGKPMSLILPDFARYDLTPALWGAHGGVAWPWLALHGLCWSALGLAADSLQLRLKSA